MLIVTFVSLVFQKSTENVLWEHRLKMEKCRRYLKLKNLYIVSIKKTAIDPSL